MTQLVWIDIETTGTIITESEILQVACIVTDRDFNVIEEHDWVVKQDAVEMKAISDDYVINMHELTGLWDRLETGLPLEEIDNQLAEIIENSYDGWAVSIGGNSVHFDNNFIKAKMPKSGSQTSHRVLDMSAVLMFMGIIGERVAMPKHITTHDALDDIRWSIEQARYAKNQIKGL
jgi:oligoribonuclease